MTEFYIHSEAQPREFVDSVDVGFGRGRTALRMAPIFLPDQMEESMKTGENYKWSRKDYQFQFSYFEMFIRHPSGKAG